MGGVNLDELERLLEAATPGRIPWHFKTGMDARIYRTDGSYMTIGDAIYHPEYVADAALIVALRNDAPELLARIRRLTEALEIIADPGDRFGEGSPITIRRRDIARHALHAPDAEGAARP